jgi:hypothetical protein
MNELGMNYIVEVVSNFAVAQNPVGPMPQMNYLDYRERKDGMRKRSKKEGSDYTATTSIRNNYTVCLTYRGIVCFQMFTNKKGSMGFSITP